MSRGPICTIDNVADYLEATQKGMEMAEDIACVILYRSELAMVLAALRGWEVDRKPPDPGTNGRSSRQTPAIPPDAAAPTPATEPADPAWDEIDRMTEEELLAGLEGIVGPLPPAEPPVQPRPPKHYGEGRQGPVERQDGPPLRGVDGHPWPVGMWWSHPGREYRWDGAGWQRVLPPSASGSTTTSGSSQVCVPKFGLDD